MATRKVCKTGHVHLIKDDSRFVLLGNCLTVVVECCMLLRLVMYHLIKDDSRSAVRQIYFTVKNFEC